MKKYRDGVWIGGYYLGGRELSNGVYVRNYGGDDGLFFYSLDDYSDHNSD